MKFGFQFEKHWDAKIGVLRKFAKKETQKWKKVEEMKRQQTELPKPEEAKDDESQLEKRLSEKCNFTLDDLIFD
jgi:hypothetical protein